MIKREIDLSLLPKTKKGIDWKKSIGYRCSFVYDNTESFLDILDYKSGKVKVKYKSTEMWMQTDSVHNAKFGILIGSINYEYIYDIGEKLIRKGKTLIIIDREIRTSIVKDGTKKTRYYKIRCGCCGNEHWIAESSLKHGSGCPFCFENSPKLCVGLNDIATTDPWMIPYFQDPNDAKKYRKTSKHQIIPICPICKKVQSKPKPIKDIYKLCGCGCSCENKMSFSEMVMCNIFDQCGINYIKELSRSTFSWVGLYRYDFYLSDKNIIIEIHGIQHYKQTPFKNSDLQKQQKRDREKKRLAEANGINKYFIIDCRNPSIKNILKSCINVGLFDYIGIDVDKLNFEKLRYNKLSNEVQKCSDILNNNPNIKYSELMRECGVNHYYDLDRILDILGVNVQHNKIPVYVYDEHGLIKQYESKSALCRDRTDYRTTSITFLNQFVDTGKKFKDKYIYSTKMLSADEILTFYDTPVQLTSNGALMTQGEVTE